MIEALVLRFDAPLMSFGGAIIDHLGVIRRFPARSMVTGLLANAFGYHRIDAQAHQQLQAKVRFATRCDVEGKRIVDFQTVDLGQPHLSAKQIGWTTRGRIEVRSGANGEGTHIREREYWADAVYTLALTLTNETDALSLDTIEAALLRPARPLFIGRKPCVPATRILVGRRKAETLRGVLESEPRVRGGNPGALTAWWDAPPSSVGIADPQKHVIEVCDERDWLNQIHGGRRLVEEGQVDPPEETM